jgi:hypothetical protein
MTPSVRALAHYLPQFHPIADNDRWWGPGFTEWCKVKKARPLFPDHEQPRVPDALGYYDLRDQQVLHAQATLAKGSGLHGFLFWHYWFAGERLLHEPVDRFCSERGPDFGYAFAWANHDWTGVWGGEPQRLLKRQVYGGWMDARAHLHWLFRHFKDERYVKVEGKPLLMILQPTQIPQIRQVMALWRTLALQAGWPGLYLVAYAWADVHHRFDPWKWGFDAATFARQSVGPLVAIDSLKKQFSGRVQEGCPSHVYDYTDLVPHLLPPHLPMGRFLPSVVPNWDNSPRMGHRAMILHRHHPEAFRDHLRRALAWLEGFPSEERILFVKSWNEWAEGNYLEPDTHWKGAFLKVLSEELGVTHRNPNQ